jgi:hypothetical protein
MSNRDLWREAVQIAKVEANIKDEFTRLPMHVFKKAQAVHELLKLDNAKPRR